MLPKIMPYIMERAREPLLPQTTTTRSAAKDRPPSHGRCRTDETPPHMVGDQSKAVLNIHSGSCHPDQHQQDAPARMAKPQGYASSSTTSSLSDHDFILEINIADDDPGVMERLAELLRLWQEHYSQTNDDVMANDGWYYTERGRTIAEALCGNGQLVMTDNNDYTFRQLAAQQRTIEAREKSQSAVVSCIIVIGTALLFAWFYVFGLTDQR